MTVCNILLTVFFLFFLFLIAYLMSEPLIAPKGCPELLYVSAEIQYICTNKATIPKPNEILTMNGDIVVDLTSLSDDNKSKRNGRKRNIETKGDN